MQFTVIGEEIVLERGDGDNAATGTFEGYASTFGVGRDGYRMLRGAVSESIAEMRRTGKAFPLLWQHNPAQPIGVVKTITEDERGIKITGQLALDTSAGRDAHALMRLGAVRNLSVGGKILESEWNRELEKEIGRPVRDIRRAELREVSVVTFSGDHNADITVVRAVVPFQDLPLASRDRAWDAATAVARVRRWAGATEAPNARYRRAFLWYDAEDAENFGAYKLPIADVVDGELMAVPRAIFAAAAVMQGARGGVDIPESDRAGVRRHIERYYAKMSEKFGVDIEPPWRRSWIEPFELGGIADTLGTVREAEGFFRALGFSKAEAMRAASAIRKSGRRWDAGDSLRDADLERAVAERLRHITQLLRGSSPCPNMSRNST